MYIFLFFFFLLICFPFFPFNGIFLILLEIVTTLFEISINFCLNFFFVLLMEVGEHLCFVCFKRIKHGL